MRSPVASFAAPEGGPPYPPPTGSLPTAAVSGSRLPSGVAGQVFALLLALLTVGLFVGSVAFHQTPLGDAWLRDTSACVERYPLEVNSSPDVLHRRNACVDAASGWLVTFELGFVGIAIVATAAATLLAPAWLIRRRQWQRWPMALWERERRVAELGSAAGHRRLPGLLLGSLTLRDAVTFGLPGRYRIVIPQKLAVTDQVELFDAVVRHELAHVRRHDVLLAWSTRPALRVAGGLLLIPAILAAIGRDASLLPSYLWRAVALLLTTTAICASILRGREFEADAGSIREPEDRLALIRALEAARIARRRGWRRWTSFHPEPTERRRALLNPYGRPTVSFLEAGAVGALVGVALPLIRGLTADRPSWLTFGSALAPLLGGLALGTSLGSMLWRAAYADGPGRRALGPLKAMGGVVLGSGIGSIVSLRAVGTVVGAADVGWANLFPPLLLGGATALVASIAGVSAAGLRGVPGRTIRLLVSVLPYACALWVSTTLAIGYDAGPLYVVLALVVGFVHPLAAVLLIVLVVAGWVLVSTRGSRPIITWGVGATVVGGLLSLTGLSFWRLSVGPAGTGDTERRLYSIVVILVLVSLGVMVLLTARFGRLGFALTLTTGPSAAALGGVLYVAGSIVLGAPIPASTLFGVTALPQGVLVLFILVWAGAGWLVVGISDLVRRPTDSEALSNASGDR